MAGPTSAWSSQPKLTTPSRSTWRTTTMQPPGITNKCKFIYSVFLSFAFFLHFFRLWVILMLLLLFSVLARILTNFDKIFVIRSCLMIWTLQLWYAQCCGAVPFLTGSGSRCFFFTGSGSGSFSYKNRLKGSKKTCFCLHI